MKLLGLINSFKFFIALCIIAIFPNGLFNYFLPDWRILKISTELVIYGLIFASILLRTPKVRLIKYIIVNGLITFITFELSNFFTYILISQSKYFEDWFFSLLLGFLFVMFGTLIIALIGRLIKNVC